MSFVSFMHLVRNASEHLYSVHARLSAVRSPRRGSPRMMNGVGVPSPGPVVTRDLGKPGPAQPDRAPTLPPAYPIRAPLRTAAAGGGSAAIVVEGPVVHAAHGPTAP